MVVWSSGSLPTRQPKVDDGPTLLDGHLPTDHGHGEIEPAAEQWAQRHHGLELGARGLRQWGLDDPATVLLIGDERQVEGAGGPRAHAFHRHRVETGHGSAREGREEQGAPGHVPTVR